MSHAIAHVTPFPWEDDHEVNLHVARTIEQLFGQTALDVCHVHEPWAPSVSSVALRTSRTLNVGTFHAPAERLIATQVARKLVELVYGRLDARLASFDATRDLLMRAFPAEYELLMPGADVADGGPPDPGRVRIGFAEDEERGALRLFLRALRRLDDDAPFDVVVRSV